MNLRTNATALALGLAMLSPATVARAGDDGVSAVLELMPSKVPFSAVVVDFEKADKSIQAFARKIDPGWPAESLIAKIKSEVGVGEWVDFSKPIGIIQGDTGSAQQAPPWAMWVAVPGFAEKVKSVDGATEEEGIWHLSYTEKDDVYVRVLGDYVVAAGSKASLAKAKVDGNSLGDVLKGRLELLNGRDALIHIDLEVLRPNVLGGVGQMRMMLPMFAMMAAQQGQTDPALITGFTTAAADAVQGLVEQLAYIDVAISMREDASGATIAAGFNEGGVKDYLMKQKPADVPPFAGLDAQPFVAAISYHQPGTESTFMEYLFGRAMAAIPATPPASTDTAAEGTGAPSAADAVRTIAKITKDFYSKVEGANALLTVSSGGMSFCGDYLGGDVKGIMELARKSLSTTGSMMLQPPGSGTGIEPLESKKIQGSTVEQFAIKIDPNNPQAAMAAKMYGTDLRYGLAMDEGRVRFYMGPAQNLERAFSGKTGKPLASAQYVNEALATLPAKHNIVLLLDIATAMSFFGPMMGMPGAAEVAPGPPISLSVSLSGEPARIDIHVPAAAIARIKQAAPSQSPM